MNGGNGAEEKRRVRVGSVADWRGERVGPFELTLRARGIEPDPAGSGVEVASAIMVESIERVDGTGGAVAVPAFVNGHAHLDLSGLGPRGFDRAGGFTGWLDMVRTERPAGEASIREAVRTGVALSRAGGVAAGGDIAGVADGRPTLEPWRTMREFGLAGVSFVEFFGFGAAEASGQRKIRDVLGDIDAVNEGPGWLASIGMGPHAPYSASMSSYRLAVELAARLGRGTRLSTHLGETAIERELIAEATGPHRGFLESLGLWNRAAEAELGRGAGPVSHTEPVLSEAAGRWVVAHMNDARDEDIAALARTGTSVAYCPRASAYFGNEPAGGHRYREMAASGVNVCLGTDSIINLDTPERVSPIDDARLLHGRDGADPVELLRMLTVRGAAALGLDEGLFTFETGRSIAGLVLLEGEGRGLAGAMGGASEPEVVLLRGAAPSEERF